MTFNERERFLYHVVTLMTMKLMSTDGIPKASALKHIVSMLKKNNLVNLTQSEINQVLRDIQKEAIRSTPLNASNTAQKKLDDYNGPKYAGAPYDQEKDEEPIRKALDRLSPGHKKDEYSTKTKEDLR